MYKLLPVAVMGWMLAAFTTVNKPSATIVTVKDLPGYKLREKIASLTDYNLWVVATRDAFHQMFIADNEAVATPDFGEVWVLAARIETWANPYEVKFKKIVEEGNTLQVYFTVQKQRRGHAGQTVAMVTASKNPDIKKVNFYHNNLLVRSVPIGLVY